MNEELIKIINETASQYFQNNPEVDFIPAKKLMPSLIAAKAFVKDEKNGLPLRKVLRALDKDAELNKIPLLHAERNEKDVYWYFVKEGAKYTSNDPEGPTKKEIKKGVITRNDENYLIDLCDEILGKKCSRQHKFSFLLGDFHKDGKTKTALPVDAFYNDLNLVLEFLQSDKTYKNLDHADKKTISGVTREEQRILYHNRKVEGLKSKEINLIIIKYDLFTLDENHKIIRNEERDLATLEKALKHYIVEEEKSEE